MGCQRDGEEDGIMIWLIIGLAVFLGIHTVRMVAPGFRAERIAAMGEGPWKGVYSLVSAIGLGMIVYGFYQARPEAALVYTPPLWTRHVALLLMALSFILLMVFNLPSGRLKPIIVHPFLAAVMLWAIAHLFANGDMASLLLFGAFLIWAGLNRLSVARRGEPAPVAGPLKYDAIAIVSGLVLWALFLWGLHQWLFGVSPIV